MLILSDLPVCVLLGGTGLRFAEMYAPTACVEDESEHPECVDAVTDGMSTITGLLSAVPDRESGQTAALLAPRRSK